MLPFGILYRTLLVMKITKWSFCLFTFLSKCNGASDQFDMRNGKRQNNITFFWNKSKRKRLTHDIICTIEEPANALPAFKVGILGNKKEAEKGGGGTGPHALNESRKHYHFHFT